MPLPGFIRCSAGNITSLVFLAILGTVTLAPLMVLPVMVGGFIDYGQFSEEQAGWIASANLLGVAIASLVVSLRIHAWRLDTIAAAGLLILIICEALSMQGGTFTGITGLRFLSGLGGGAAASAVIAALARLSNSERGYGMLIMFQFGLGSIGLWGLPLIMADHGINGLFACLLAIELSCLLIVPLLSSYDAIETEASSANISSSTSPSTPVLLTSAAVLSLVAIGVYEMANLSTWTYIERIGLTTGMSNEDVGSTLGLSALVSIPGAFAVAWLGNSLGRTLPLISGITVACIAMTGLIVSKSPIGFTFFLCLYSAAWAFTLPYFQGIQAALDKNGSVAIAGQFTTMLGSALGPALAASLVGDNHYNGAIYASLFLYLVSLAVVLPVAISLSQKSFNDVSVVPRKAV